MPSTRQDAWTADEDILLAETVLRHIREGSTQLKAFEEVGTELSRTAAACGFRWNSYVRKQYQAGIELAKQQRKENKKRPVDEQLNEPLQPETSAETRLPKDQRDEITTIESIAFEDVIRYLKTLYEDAKNNAAHETTKSVENKCRQLEAELLDLEAENSRLIQELHAVERAYRVLTETMERARKMVSFHGVER